VSNPEKARRRKVPLPSRGETALAVGKAALSIIPLAGAPAAELLGLIVTPILDQRREDFLASVGRGIIALEERFEGFRREQLAKNEAFATTAAHAVWSALRTHQREKLKALRNIVLNAALPGAPDDDLQLMFLDAIDVLTGWHLQLLEYFNDPKGWIEKRGMSLGRYAMASPSTVLEDVMPELKDKRDFYDRLYMDLGQRGFLPPGTNVLHGMTSTSGLVASHTTPLGKQFVRFITAPIEGLDNDGD
jgi:hypothetical protein